MTLGELIEDSNWSDLTVSGISEDSRTVQPGDLFIAASKDLQQRTQHVHEAVQAGAVAALVPELMNLQAPIPLVPLADLAARRSEIASRYYQHPSRELCWDGRRERGRGLGLRGVCQDSSHRQHLRPPAERQDREGGSG